MSARAAHFARTGATNSDDPCVICLFIPEKFRQTTIRSDELKKHSCKLEQLRFPSVTGLFFRENEVALFGAIYPQCIFAVYDVASKECFWNPALFSASLGVASEIWVKGLAVDQGGFESLLSHTGYAIGLEKNSEGIETEIYPK